MGPPCLAESASQHLVFGIQKYKGAAKASSELAKDLGKLLERLAFANVDDQRAALFRLVAQIREFWHQRDGKIVHRVKSEIFKRLERRQLARAAHPGNDDQ